MTSIPTGTSLDLLGPLGHGFTAFSGKRPSLLLGGGYGWVLNKIKGGEMSLGVQECPH